MMKIGILTLPLHSNYGGILQAYALQTIIKSMGHDVYLLQIKEVMKKPPFYFFKRILKNVRDLITNMLGYKNGGKYTKIERQHTDRFIMNNIHNIRNLIIKDNILINGDCSDLDTIIVGSDQVWRPSYVNIELYFLSFLNSVSCKKISYAASFGTDINEFSDDQLRKCSVLLSLFEAVSVRENSGVEFINYKLRLNCKPIVSLDPTLLLGKEHYIKLCNAKYEIKKNKLFYYILDSTDDKFELIRKVSKILNKEPYTSYAINENHKKKIEYRIYPPVEQWISGIYNAEYVLTDSFHGCVFSILFNKPFFVYGNNKRGLSRFKTLLNEFSLENRMLFSSMEITEERIKSPINWNSVNNKLAHLRSLSMSFLNSNI